LRIGIETAEPPGVELADVDGRGVVLRRLAGVGGDRLRSPRARLRGRVVERLVVDGDVAGLAAGLLERQLDAVHHGRRLRREAPCSGSDE
jgi:hypothetical protein